MTARRVREASTGYRALLAVLLVLCDSACGDTLEWQTSNSVLPATLSCNEPVPEPFLVETFGVTEPVPAAPDAAELMSLGVADLENRIGHGLLAIDPQQRPYEVQVPERCVPLGQAYSTIAKICVDASGDVSGLTIVMSSLPIIDSQLPYVLSLWRYHPYLVDGVATAFCYDLKYSVR